MFNRWTLDPSIISLADWSSVSNVFSPVSRVFTTTTKTRFVASPVELAGLVPARLSPVWCGQKSLPLVGSIDAIGAVVAVSLLCHSTASLLVHSQWDHEGYAGLDGG